MDFESFKTLVEKNKIEQPVWFGLDPDSVVVGAIIDVEDRLGTKLPEEYKEFVFEYGGGYFAFSNVFSLEVGSDWNIVDLNLRYNDKMDDYIMFSENGVGDFYGFKITDNICESSVYFYDHEIKDWKETIYDNIFDYLAKFAFSN